MDYLVHHLVWASARRFPDQEAVAGAGERLTYRQFHEQVIGVGQGLRQAGVARGERIGVLLEPGVPLAVSLFAISQAGGAFVPIHPSLLTEQVEHIARDCQMSAIITTAARWKELRPTLTQIESLRFVVLVDGNPELEATVPEYAFAAWRDERNCQPPGDLAIEKDLVAILYTSGSTGKPKGVMLSHANLIAGASIVSEYLSITSSDRILAVLPFSFDAGLNQLMTAVQQGGACIMMKFLFAREIVAMLEKERITGLAGVPSLWGLLAQPNSKLAQTKLEHLRYITNTGGALPLSVLGRLREALPSTQVFLMYGLTEAFRSTYLPPEELDRRPTSMGKAIPNTEILVINEQGAECGPGEVGELVHRGPTVSLGYWGRQDLTDRVLRPHPFARPEIGDVERVCYSGDLVRKDEEGFLYFVGRRDNLIKSSGFRISPNEVEEGLCRCEGVREAAVIGLPDELLGQRIKAFVVPQEGHSLDVDDLLQQAATRLPRHMAPKAIEVLSELPKTSSGKIDYPALRRREAESQPTSSAVS